MHSPESNTASQAFESNPASIGVKIKSENKNDGLLVRMSWEKDR
jgi:hypothetical protein